MNKKIKLKIKNTQLAKAAGLDRFKAKLSGEKKKAAEEKKEKDEEKAKAKAQQPIEEEEKPRRIRARSKSAFAPEKTAEQPVETPPPQKEEQPVKEEETAEEVRETEEQPAEEKLGPTGRHVKDLLPKKTEEPKKEKQPEKSAKESPAKEKAKAAAPSSASETQEAKELKKGKKVREFKDLKPARRQQPKTFDARDRQGLSESDDERWRKKRGIKSHRSYKDEQIIRPTELKIRLPISIKDLAAEMKLKASEVIQKLFLHGMTYTLNDLLDDETTVQFIGSEFGCTVQIDTSEEERIQITSESIREEIASSDPESLKIRPPVVAFMGHVDHGKTSLIDAIRKSDIVAGEAGAITQHIGAFKCKTAVGDITILDTPGHEAFSAMRSRGAEVTDIVVLVVAGDEGLKEQTSEAIQHAKAAGVTIVVAINKCDKPAFNPENVYRELSEAELLPETWGGQTITVNTSAITGEGISTLLEMLALQAEVLELKANPNMRARGTVLESELHKGLGNVTTVLVQNGTLRQGDALVFEQHWGKVKTMHDEHGVLLSEAGPSTPIEITGLSGLPAAGDPFIVVKNEKEAREITEARDVGEKQRALQQRKIASLDLLQKGAGDKKILKLILRADVQGSVEALKASILKIESEKARADVIFTGVGEISESDIQLASASNAVIIGFHTAIESHAEPLIKELGVTVKLFSVIYHAIEDVRNIMLGMLDKIAEEQDTGTAEVLQVFKSSQLGMIAGCQVTNGIISRNHLIRVIRNDEMIWKGSIASIKRVKEDVKEVKKGLECGILLDGFNALQPGDVLQAYEIVYRSQEL